MKKLTVLLLTVLLLITGCGADHSEEMKKAVSDFMVALDDGDFEKAQTLCNDTVTTQLGIKNLEETLTTQFKDSFKATSSQNFEDYNKETQDALTDFIKYLLKVYVSKYTIQDDFDKDKGTVTVDVELLSANALNVTEATNLTKKLATKYQEKHLDKLQEIYVKKGQTAYAQALMEGIAKDYFKGLEELLDKATTDKETWILTVSEEDGAYKITNLTTK